jgi:DNA-binding MarR family transcriptional regulator
MEDKTQVSMLLKMLDNSLDSQCNRNMKDIELTASQSNIMGYLVYMDGKEVSQRDIELEFKLMNPTVTGILNRLEKKGFIVRVKSRTDARYNYIELTEKGREIPEIVRKKTMEIHKRLFQGLSQAEIDMFENIIKKMIENISK